MSKNITIREAVAGDGQQLKKDTTDHGTNTKEEGLRGRM